MKTKYEETAGGGSAVNVLEVRSSNAELRPAEGFAIDALLFDVGNVLIEIDFDRVFRRWADDAACDLQAIKARFEFDEAYERHERGEIDAAQYFAGLRRMLGIDLSDRKFLAGWNALFVGEVAGMRELLTRAGKHLPLYAFTNTNAAHHLEWSTRFDAICAPLTRLFASSQLGLRKPEAKAFEAVTQAMGVAPQRVLFFDDSPDNVRGAREAGLRAIRVTAFSDVAAALEPLLVPR